MSTSTSTSIQRPTAGPFQLDKNTRNLSIQVIDYYRCLDTLDAGEEDDSDNEDEEEVETTGQYTKEQQKELSYKYPMLIKAYGILESGHSITINLQGFQPFFYIKIPDRWKPSQCSTFVAGLRAAVYYKYKDHLVKNPKSVWRKPFTEFTGHDQFKFLKLTFTNKESYDAYAFKLSRPLEIKGLHGGQAYQYDLYESNIEPILKFIHLSRIQPTGWVTLPKGRYSIVRQHDRTTRTNFEVTIDWRQVAPLEQLESAPLNIAAFDIEADSSHGDFPIGIKTYQKLAQDLITMYNEHGLDRKRTHAHRLFKESAKQVIRTSLHLAFDPNYNNNGIHQIITVDHLKPHPETVDQLAYAIVQLLEQCTGGSSSDSAVLNL